MFRGLFLIFCSVLFASFNTQAEAPQNLDIYLLIGQSNMAGRGPMQEGDDNPIVGAWLFNDNAEFEVARSPMNRYSTIRKKPTDDGYQKLNPGHLFASTMLQNEGVNNIGIICNAKGGTRIEKWAQGGAFYTEAIKRTKEAMKYGTLKGVLWHQGESNKDDCQYLQKIKDLVANLREDLGSKNLPFVAGEILQNVSDSGEGKINQQLAELPRSTTCTAVVSAKGLTDRGDQLHFDNASQKELGKRYAEAVLKLKNRGPAL
jgi:hypothetical protein